MTLIKKPNEPISESASVSCFIFQFMYGSVLKGNDRGGEEGKQKFLQSRKFQFRDRSKQKYLEVSD